jgi:hypothetical protein
MLVFGAWAMIMPPAESPWPMAMTRFLEVPWISRRSVFCLLFQHRLGGLGQGELKCGGFL